jgi:hypothetical protein
VSVSAMTRAFAHTHRPADKGHPADDGRGWTAAWQFAHCVICHQPAILRSPRGKPCHWTCVLTWVQVQDARVSARKHDNGKPVLETSPRRFNDGRRSPPRRWRRERHRLISLTGPVKD